MLDGLNNVYNIKFSYLFKNGISTIEINCCVMPPASRSYLSSEKCRLSNHAFIGISYDN